MVPSFQNVQKNENRTKTPTSRANVRFLGKLIGGRESGLWKRSKISNRRYSGGVSEILKTSFFCNHPQTSLSHHLNKVGSSEKYFGGGSGSKKKNSRTSIFFHCRFLCILKKRPLKNGLYLETRLLRKKIGRFWADHKKKSAVMIFFQTHQKLTPNHRNILLGSNPPPT